MPYSTYEDVRIAAGGTRSLVELADIEETHRTDGGAGVADTVSAAIREADGVINSYLGQRYLVPLGPGLVSDALVALSAAWAVRVLRRGRYKGQPIAEDIDGEKIAREWLRGVAAGVIQLGVEPIPEKGSIIIDKAAGRDTTMEISRCRLKDFI